MFFIRFFLKIMFIIGLFAYFFLRSADAQAWNSYQNSDFYKVETLCKDVINDLSVMKFDARSVSISWVDQTAYISEQLVALQEALCNLRENEEEARMYLTEEYEYLEQLFARLEEHFNLWHEAYHDNYAQRAVRVCLQRVMQESKKNLQEIVALNREVKAWDIDVFYCVTPKS